MPERRKKILILLCGMLIATATPLCHAQDTETQFEVKKPRAEVAPTLLPAITNIPPPIPVEVKPAKGASELPWYLRVLGWLAMDIARYNTEKQNDGRPQPSGNTR